MLTKFVQLPSKGLYYKQGHPLHGKQVIQVKLLTARQQDILTDETLARTGGTVQALIDRIIVDKSVKQNTLLAGDRVAILIKTRQLSLGAEYKFEWGCTSCNISQQGSVDLSLLKHKGIPQKQGDPVFEVLLPNTGKIVKVKLFTAADQQAIKKTQRNRKKAKLPLNSVTVRLRQAIISVDGSQEVGAINSFVESLPAADAGYLRKQIYEKTPDVDLEVKLQCRQCGASKKMMLPIGASFFRSAE